MLTYISLLIFLVVLNWTGKSVGKHINLLIAEAAGFPWTYHYPNVFPIPTVKIIFVRCCGLINTRHTISHRYNYLIRYCLFDYISLNGSCTCRPIKIILLFLENSRKKVIRRNNKHHIKKEGFKKISLNPFYSNNSVQFWTFDSFYPFWISFS